MRKWRAQNNSYLLLVSRKRLREMKMFVWFKLTPKKSEVKEQILEIEHASSGYSVFYCRYKE